MIPIVREFYANFPNDVPEWVVVRGIRVHFDSRSISNIFQLPDDDDEYEDYLCSLEEQDSEEFLMQICEPGTTWDKSSQVASTVNIASLLL